jgi:hypothetical protein
VTDAPAPTAPPRLPVSLDQARLDARLRLVKQINLELAELAAALDALPQDDAIGRNDAAVAGMAAIEIRNALQVGIKGLEHSLRQAARPRILQPERSLKIVRS